MRKSVTGSMGLQSHPTLEKFTKNRAEKVKNWPKHFECMK